MSVELVMPGVVWHITPESMLIIPEYVRIFITKVIGRSSKLVMFTEVYPTSSMMPGQNECLINISCMNEPLLRHII